jgi:hypothetical protein
MMTLVRICGQHWHAVERDLLVLGYHKEDIGTEKLTLWELISVVVSSPPGTAVFHAETRSGTLTQEAQFLANMSEQMAGVPLHARYERPGVDPTPFQQQWQPPKADSFASLPDYGGFKLDALPPGEMVRKRAELAATMRDKEAAGELNTDRMVADKFSLFRKPNTSQLFKAAPAPRIWES